VVTTTLEAWPSNPTLLRPTQSASCSRAHSPECSWKLPTDSRVSSDQSCWCTTRCRVAAMRTHSIWTRAACVWPSRATASRASLSAAQAYEKCCCATPRQAIASSASTRILSTKVGEPRYASLKSSNGRLASCRCGPSSFVTVCFDALNVSVLYRSAGACAEVHASF